MRSTSATNAFFLAWFTLFSIPSACNASPSASTPSSTSTNINPDVCAVSRPQHPSCSIPNLTHPTQLNPTSRVSDACASYADLDTLNAALAPTLHNLTTATDFFAYYRLNLYNQQCPFWSDETGLCGNIACAVTTLEHEEDIPPIWRAQELSKLEGPKASHPGRKQQKEREQRPLLGELGDGVGESCVVEYDDECDERDYCVPEDESASAKGDYVSLVDNPERFTGYAGEGAQMVWEAIYRENCFSRPGQGSGSSSGFGMPGLSKKPGNGLAANRAQAAMDFRSVLKRGGDALEPTFEDECLEKRVFYRVISGMHASISTHLCADYLNQTTGEWGPNLQCYKERLHEHPERIANLYFNYAFVLRAVGKLRDYVQDYTFCTGDTAQDVRTREMMHSLASSIPAGPRIFDESVMFHDHAHGGAVINGLSLKEDFRNRFRNVSRIMDCVGCDKCRLWGKVQTNGFGTALKVLFEFGNGEGRKDGQVGEPLLRRTELVALVNTLEKISAAIGKVAEFRAMIAAEEKGNTPSPDTTTPELEDELDDFTGVDTDNETDMDAPPTMSSIFYDEFELVYRTFFWVLRSWVALPGKLGRIVVLEANRLWNLWLGGHVGERSWEFRPVAREEL